jgi:hypothetical protein
VTWKAGDTVTLPVFFETDAGVAQSFANAAAFIGAGGNFTWYNAGVALASQPTWTLAPQGQAGSHALTFVLPAGVDIILPTYPAGIRSDPWAFLLVTPIADTDALNAIVAGFTSVPVAGASFSSFDLLSIEGDIGPVWEFQIPAASLVVFDPTLGKYSFTDLSDVGGNPWRIAAQARGPWGAGQLPASAVAWTYTATITDKVNRKVAIGWATSPAGALVVNPDGSPDTAGTQPQSQYLFDIQLQPPVGSTYAAYKLTVVVGTHTIKRQQTTSP